VPSGAICLREIVFQMEKGKWRRRAATFRSRTLSWRRSIERQTETLGFL